MAWHHTTDVLVLGSGAAALTAYLKVLTEGAIDEDRLRTFVVEANRMVETFQADSHMRFEALAECPDGPPSLTKWS